ncbi:hypothetical protein [Bordetella bronchiseptica]|uniref:Membrane protein n=3 Tax=Bordetella bronchiseptica TaxID=518 RepID=A0A0H3LNB9_BORBR|nr:hypothetical protein [Bordetella bronchiseptica]AMG89056.1 hypothetical protein AL472_15815 [Bordetella bronchiseptica]AWP75133.1 hypothetical protein B7P10_11990 [Bordetella bronchiseptica]AWP79918.1 hypothetical protein B7P04_11730 [Bordetella bronchiseptica]AWP84729.1 hypothetical protein B7P00_11770 [Bordetella bronchiseptica]AWQ10297.1 hypothetical protein B9G72_11755 [Bordetella bronchiseptica]
MADRHAACEMEGPYLEDIDMKQRSLIYLVAGAMAALLAHGGALAQSGTAPTTPSTTPNDSTAVPPNRPVPPGQVPPAPGTTTHDGMPKTPQQHMNEQRGNDTRGDMPRRQPDINDNPPATPAQGASPPPGYPNTGGSK